MGNTFGATALASYSGFWISFAIILTPGGFQIVESLGGEKAEFINSFGFFLMVRPGNSLPIYQISSKHSRPILSVCVLGLVHLHHFTPPRHLTIHAGVFPPLLPPRHHFPPSWYRLSQSRRQGCTPRTRHQGGWVLRSSDGLHGLV